MYKEEKSSIVHIFEQNNNWCSCYYQTYKQALESPKEPEEEFVLYLKGGDEQGYRLTRDGLKRIKRFVNEEPIHVAIYKDDVRIK